MQIIALEAGPLATNGYLVIDETSNKCVIIDTPLVSAEQFLLLINERNLQLQSIFLTHSHWDHVGDCKKIADATNCDVFIHQLDDYRLKDPQSHTLIKLPFTIEAYNNAKFYDSNEILHCGNMNFEILHTPGHTEGSVCILEKAHKVVFTGDTIFEGNVGRIDLPGGSRDNLINSLKNIILQLPDDYKIYSGHGEKTTIGRERKFNPFLI